MNAIVHFLLGVFFILVTLLLIVGTTFVLTTAIKEWFGYDIVESIRRKNESGNSGRKLS